ncbi:MAG: hypothetical protein JWN13_648 [Betaproteobacteria bacterium]|jgi:hypothetical protein|nr:hypothetical protein [Betaproteobacteria bacterium]
MSNPRSQRRTLATVVLSFALSALFGATVFAKLPALTEEQQAASIKKGSDEKAQLQKEQEALTQAQDRVAEHYRRQLTMQGKVPPVPTPVGQTAAKDLPKVVGVPPRSDGPHGGNTPSAESHSAPAK